MITGRSTDSHRHSDKSEEEAKEIGGKEEEPPGLLLRVLKLASPELTIIIVAVIASCGSGLIFPFFSFIFSEMVSIFETNMRFRFVFTELLIFGFHHHSSMIW